MPEERILLTIMNIPLMDFHALNDHLLDDFTENVKKVFESGHYTLGSHVQRFEETFAKYVGCKFGIGVNSGTDALMVCLKSLGVGAGDQVLCPVLAPSNVAEAIARLGATPVLVDVRPDSLNMDPDHAIASITSGTRAMIVVHNFGLSAEIDRLLQIARTYSVAVIEHATMATGARFHGRRIGSFGNFACFGLGPDAALGAVGSAGAITTNDENFVDHFRRLRDHGFHEGASANHDVIGFDSTMDAVQAVFLSLKMADLDDNNLDRIANAERYFSRFAGSSVRLPVQRDDNSHIYSSFVIQVPDRDKLVEDLTAKGIETRIPYGSALHLMPCFAYLEYREGAFPVAEEAVRQMLAIPVWAGLKRSKIDEVAQAITNFYGVTA